MGARQKKKLALLAGQSAKAFLYIDIYMFLKQANSDRENSYTWKLEKTL